MILEEKFTETSLRCGFDQTGTGNGESCPGNKPYVCGSGGNHIITIEETPVSQTQREALGAAVKEVPPWNCWEQFCC